MQRSSIASRRAMRRARSRIWKRICAIWKNASKRRECAARKASVSYSASLDRRRPTRRPDMEIDFEAITESQRYKLMASLIVPRPIALVTTLGADGTINAAPFSMFNMLGEEPPIVMISVNRVADGTLKDTAVNIVRTGEFVVHLADE